MVTREQYDSWQKLEELIPGRAREGTHLEFKGEPYGHEAKPPHADVISERLETLVSLASWTQLEPGTRDATPPFVVTSVAALLQRSFLLEIEAVRVRLDRVSANYRL